MTDNPSRFPRDFAREYELHWGFLIDIPSRFSRDFVREDKLHWGWMTTYSNRPCRNFPQHLLVFTRQNNGTSLFHADSLLIPLLF